MAHSKKFKGLLESLSSGVTKFENGEFIYPALFESMSESGAPVHGKFISLLEGLQKGTHTVSDGRVTMIEGEERVDQLSYVYDEMVPVFYNLFTKNIEPNAEKMARTFSKDDIYSLTILVALLTGPIQEEDAEIYGEDKVKMVKEMQDAGYSATLKAALEQIKEFSLAS